MSVDQSITTLFTQASPVVQLVMLLLLLASVFSWNLILQGRQRFKKANKLNRKFEETFWSGTDLNRLYQTLSAAPSEQMVGSQQLFLAGFREYRKLRQTAQSSDPQLLLASIERSMRVACVREMEDLEKSLPFLATVGSVSPYVGLFGTVWGIMNAFRALGTVQQASLAMVAPGISEALVATAMGLFAAIPAVMAYNRFSTRLQSLGTQYTAFMDEFLTLLNRQVLSKATVSPATVAQQATPNAQVTHDEHDFPDPLTSKV